MVSCMALVIEPPPPYSPGVNLFSGVSKFFVVAFQRLLLVILSSIQHCDSQQSDTA